MSLVCFYSSLNYWKDFKKIDINGKEYDRISRSKDRERERWLASISVVSILFGICVLCEVHFTYVSTSKRRAKRKKWRAEEEEMMVMMSISWESPRKERKKSHNRRQKKLSVNLHVLKCCWRMNRSRNLALVYNLFDIWKRTFFCSLLFSLKTMPRWTLCIVKRRDTQKFNCLSLLTLVFDNDIEEFLSFSSFLLIELVKNLLDWPRKASWQYLNY